MNTALLFLFGAFVVAESTVEMRQAPSFAPVRYAVQALTHPRGIFAVQAPMTSPVKSGPVKIAESPVPVPVFDPIPLPLPASAPVEVPIHPAVVYSAPVEAAVYPSAVLPAPVAAPFYSDAFLPAPAPGLALPYGINYDAAHPFAFGPQPFPYVPQPYPAEVTFVV